MIFQISKDAPCYTLIRKCQDAVEREDLSGLSKKDFETALDRLADAWADRCGKDRATAAAEVLAMQVGKGLYSGYTSAGAMASAAS